MLSIMRWARAPHCHALIVFGLFLFSESIAAYPVTWEFNGTITQSAGNAYGLSADLPVGTPVRILVSFDTDETYSTRPSSDDRPGVRYEYVPDSLRFAIFGSACNPCAPNFVPGIQGIHVRDNFADPLRNPPPDAPRDGYSFFVDPHPDNDNLRLLLLVRDLADAFDPPIVDIGEGENPLPVDPDPRLAQMAEAVFQVTDSVNDNSVVEASLDLVRSPLLGTWYFLSARHCLYPDGETYTGQFLGDDCVAGGAPSNGVSVSGGGAGHSGYSNTVTHFLETPDPNDAPDARDELGTVYGSINFGGPLGMPILKGSSVPTDLARTNSNLFAYQQYNFNGTETTPLELLVDIEYTIQSDALATFYPPENTVKPGEKIQTGLTPGGSELTLVMSIVDASIISTAAMATQEFGSITCGNESALLLPNGDPWPAGSILGGAIYFSPDNQQGAHATQLAIRACAGSEISAEPVMVSPGNTFHLSASMQTPARGKLKQDGSAGAANNGLINAADTVQVIPDPEAPPEVLEQLSSGVTPVCENCGPPQPEVIFSNGFE